MNYRYQEILAWIIPGFFLIVTTFIIWGYVHGGVPFINERSSTLVEHFSTIQTSGQFWNAAATILLFLIPITAMLIGWIVNFLGGRIMKRSYLRKHILSSVYPNDKKDKSPDAVAEYDHIIRTSDFKTLEYLDRFYYRYVFSRNMMAAQILLIITSLLFFMNASSTQCGCGIIIIEGGLAILFIFIMARDLKTHASFVFNHADSPIPQQ